MTAQLSVVRPYRHTTAEPFGFRTDFEGRALLMEVFLEAGVFLMCQTRSPKVVDDEVQESWGQLQHIH